MNTVQVDALEQPDWHLDNVVINPEGLLFADERLVGFAEEMIQAGLPAASLVDRFAKYDLIYPADLKEYQATGGQAILIVTASTKDETEFPLKRCYIKRGWHTFELGPIAASSSINPEGLASTVYGSHRYDALYLVPLELMSSRSTLYVDFAVNRDGFSVGVLERTVELPYSIREPILDLDSSTQKTVITEILVREHPAFINKRDE
jgi:hypothetical protein